jgi:hypothetical protein
VIETGKTGAETEANHVLLISPLAKQKSSRNIAGIFHFLIFGKQTVSDFTQPIK